MLDLYIIQSILAKLGTGFKTVLKKTILTSLSLKKPHFWNITVINQFTAREPAVESRVADIPVHGMDAAPTCA